MFLVFHIVNQLINYKIFFSPANNWSLLSSASSFILFILFILSFAFFLFLSFFLLLFQTRVVFPKIYILVLKSKSISNFSKISLISSGNIFNTLFVSFFISFISCSLSSSSYFYFISMAFKLFKSSLNFSTVCPNLFSLKKETFLVFVCIHFLNQKKSLHWFSRAALNIYLA